MFWRQNSVQSFDLQNPLKVSTKIVDFHQCYYTDIKIYERCFQLSCKLAHRLKCTWVISWQRIKEISGVDF